MQQISIYIHWPFCKSKCPYCDFNSHVRNSINEDQWNKAYTQELQNYKDYLSDKKIVSIFFGGGTPSLMPSYIIANIINSLSIISNIDDNIEITLEANPTSVESKKFKEFSRAGINRVSLGIQSLDENNLKFLGREHSVNEAIAAIEIAKENFKRYSFDLIYALPEQTLNSWEKQLQEALKLADKHLSLYQLTIEKGTPFYSQYKNNKFQIPNEDLAKDFYNITQQIMENINMPAYEISNHAASGEECKHNLTYWQYGDFLGIGPGAHSRINNQAFHSIYNPENWLENALKGEIVTQNLIELSLEEKISEMLLMGLRLTKGINEADFQKKLGLKFSEALKKNKLEFLIDNQFLEFNNNYLYTTDKGKIVLNSIVEQLVK
ncbi:MAG: radical SAM family heme chaperone HemW [Rickettsiales bacterium]